VLVLMPFGQAGEFAAGMQVRSALAGWTRLPPGARCRPISRVQLACLHLCLPFKLFQALSLSQPLKDMLLCHVAHSLHCTCHGITATFCLRPIALLLIAGAMHLRSLSCRSLWQPRVSGSWVHLLRPWQHWETRCAGTAA
jgi:hypothetical protein